MMSPTIDPTDAIADAVRTYQADGDLDALLGRLHAVMDATPDVDALIAAVEPYHTIPEIAGPVYERVVAARPADGRALVILANAYWLGGRGPDAVEELATRALAADPANRGAWHLWALSEPAPRERLARWRQVAERFPDDELARATLADSAASVASTDGDREAWALALGTYRGLLATARHPAQRAALEQAIATLEGWRL